MTETYDCPEPGDGSGQPGQRETALGAVYPLRASSYRELPRPC